MATTLIPAIFFGIAAPVAAAIASWLVVRQTYRHDPLRVTGVMLRAWAAKAVFFVTYVIAMIRGLGVDAQAFAISLAAAFIVSYAVEALALRRLFSRAWRGAHS